MAEWFYRFDGKDLGPISEEDLRHVFESGALPISTFVWREGMSDWKPANECLCFSSRESQSKGPSKTSPKLIPTPNTSRADCQLTGKIENDKRSSRVKKKLPVTVIVCLLLVVVSVLVLLWRHRVSNSFPTNESVADSQLAGRPIAELLKCAEAGDAACQNMLGTKFSDGEGMEKNEAKAFLWYQKSADQGYAKAQANLGMMYYNGHGVEKDLSKAVELLRKGADQECGAAQAYLGMAYLKGEGVEKDISQAVKWTQKAAFQGFPGGQFMLAAMYATGNGVERNLVESYAWFSLSAEVKSAVTIKAVRQRNNIEAQLSQSQLTAAKDRVGELRRGILQINPGKIIAESSEETNPEAIDCSKAFPELQQCRAEGKRHPQLVELLKREMFVRYLPVSNSAAEYTVGELYVEREITRPIGEAYSPENMATWSERTLEWHIKKFAEEGLTPMTGELYGLLGYFLKSSDSNAEAIRLVRERLDGYYNLAEREADPVFYSALSRNRPK